MVLRAANQNYYDCRWQSYLNSGALVRAYGSREIFGNSGGKGMPLPYIHIRTAGEIRNLFSRCSPVESVGHGHAHSAGIGYRAVIAMVQGGKLLPKPPPTGEVARLCRDGEGIKTLSNTT